MSQEPIKPVAHGRVAVAEALVMREASSEAAGGHSAAFRFDRGSEASSGIASESPK